MEKDYAQIRAEARIAETKAMRRESMKYFTVSVVVVLFVLLVRFRFAERRNIARERFTEIVDQAHPNDLVDVHLGKFVVHKIRQQRDAPAMLRNVLCAPLRGRAVARHILQALGDVQRFQQLLYFHDICLLRVYY